MGNLVGQDFDAYSVDNDEVRTIQKFKFGTQIAFPERIVELMQIEW